MPDSKYLIAHCGHTLKSHEHICWWKPDSKGYTICVDKAGRYSARDAIAICESSECMAIPECGVTSMALSTPYYRRQNGTLGRLYDGGPHRPIANTRGGWTVLKRTALIVGRYAKPTPIPASESRVIYLDGVEIPTMEEPAMPDIDTGDHVRHVPTGEDWVVARVKGDRLAWCGWPQGWAALADCQLIKKAMPEQRLKLLRDLADSSGHHCADWARERLEGAEHGQPT